MMRYQRVSPDYNPLSNGSKSSFRCKEDGENGTKTILTNTTNGGGFRFRSPSKLPPPAPQPSSQENTTTNQYNNSNNHCINNSNNTTAASASASAFGSASSPLSDNNFIKSNGNGNGSSSRGGGGGGDALLQLQWGNKKRARLSRTEIRLLNSDDSSSSSIHRRAGSPFFDRPPPPPPPPMPHPSNATSTSTRPPSNLRTKDSPGFINRNIEDRSAGGNGSPLRNCTVGNSRAISRSTAGKGSTHSSEKFEKRMRKEEKTTNGGLARTDVLVSSTSTAATTTVQSEQETRAAVAAANANTLVSISVAEKVNVEAMEWPKIFIALSRKEKEDDFLAMRGTKLPHRPKKRAKNVDRALQYCFPGMWLSDLTKSRYEVREKKSVKKQKRRGLKGMESMESDSE